MANTVRRPRSCEVCSTQYRPTYHEQRSCGRVCGRIIQHGPAVTKVAWRQCKHCSLWYTAKGRKRCGCTGYKPTSGIRSVQCRDCAKPFGYLIVSNYPARCPDCRELERKRVQRNGRKARRALQRGAQVEPVNVLEIYERDRWRCGLCSKHVDKLLKYPHPKSASLDHVVPLSLHGAHGKANVQLAHLCCNIAKSNGGGQQLALIG